MPQHGLYSWLALAQGVIFFVMLFVAAATDLTSGKVYNAVCAVGFAAGLILSTIRGGLWGEPVSLASSLSCAAAGFALFLFFYWTGGLGGGDVKLMAAAGALAANLRFLLYMVTCTALAGVPLAIGVLVWKGEFKSGMRRTLRGMTRLRFPRQRQHPDQGDAQDRLLAEGLYTHLPYAVAICTGGIAAAALFAGRSMPLPFL